MSLLPNAMRIQDDFPLILKRSIPLASNPPVPAPVNDWFKAMPSDKPPKMVRLRLTEEAEAESEDFYRVYDGGNCSCHISPPCSSCMHPGNPLNLQEDDSAWVMGFEGAQQ